MKFERARVKTLALFTFKLALATIDQVLERHPRPSGRVVRHAHP